MRKEVSREPLREGALEGILEEGALGGGSLEGGGPLRGPLREGALRLVLMLSLM